MDLLLDPELLPLMEQAVDGELDIPVGEGRLRVDLKPDNIRLWQETLDRIQPSGNLLLACENSEGSLASTQLTWVVGAAIRSASVSGTPKRSRFSQISESMLSSSMQHGGVVLALEVASHGLFTWSVTVG